MTITSGEALAQTSDEVVLRNVVAFVDIYGVGADTVYASGLTTLEWSERYFNGMTDIIDTELYEVRLHGDLAGACISFQTHGTLPSPGQVVFPAPGEDFPAESFFDVFVEITIPDHMPGQTLHTSAPIHISDIIDQMPPYFCPHEMIPPAAIIIYDEAETPVGEISFWKEEIIPYSPPEAYLTAETSKGTDIAVAYNDTLMLEAAVAGYVEPLPGMPACMQTFPFSAEFGIRPSGLPDPFMPFYTDLDGLGKEIGSVEPINEGDGWAGYLDVGPYPEDGELYDIEVVFDFGSYDLRDTITVFIDPTPIIPGFVNFEPDSICYTPVDHVKSIAFQVPAVNVAQVALKVQPLAANWQRVVPAVNQHELSSKPSVSSVACGPAAAASCLKFWANNGHHQLDHPPGNVTAPAASAKNIGKELVGDMDPKAAKNGSQIGAIEGGITKYLNRHGAKDWKVKGKEIKNMTDLAEMMREFEADSEDVILIASDTTRDKDNKLVRKGHAVTMSSRKSEVYEVEVDGKKVQKTRQHIDFMNPNDGSLGDENEFEVGTDSEGRPTTKLYSNVDNVHGDSHIHGYIKVSPPAGGTVESPRVGAGWKSSFHMPQEYAAPTYGNWTIVDTGPGLGGGLPDTLYWDTTGFPGGLYLMEITATDVYGNTGTALRFAGIPEYLVDANEPEIPPLKTGIRSSYPNPFNPTTTIEYNVARRTAVTLSVYDVGGRLISVLIDRQVKDAGVYKTVWDGTNSSGSRVASSVYFCVINTEDGINSRKMILLR